MSNHLSRESSPYLLQHAKNPVEWYPWGEEAFQRARQEDKPVFLSIGYSTCHWCHVMARESFENERVAEVLNQHFISIKVDREERPDIDSVYMAVCQAFTGRGGWPMSIFMTAEQKPFFAGTYFPAESWNGMIGFLDLLLTIARRWEDNREELLASAEDITRQMNVVQNRRRAGAVQDELEKEESALQGMSVPTEGAALSGMSVQQEKAVLSGMSVPPEGDALSGRAALSQASLLAESLLPEKAAKAFADSFDKKYGGFGTAPKFPMAHNLLFLMLYSQINDDREALHNVAATLLALRRGGIFDQIGYGFSRYSTDRAFLVPHFEKMLYDNALLIIAYLAAYKTCGNGLFLDTAKKTAEYIFREMTDEEGGFYSAQDADSDGEEGKYYLWDEEEICSILGEERGKEFCGYYGVTRQGNFEGRNILNLLQGQNVSEQFLKEEKSLLEYRGKRDRLHLDDKILTSWNSLMICAMALLYRTTGEEKYLLAAQRADRFIEENLAEGRLLYVSCRQGRRMVPGFLEDYACYAAAKLFLYDVTSDMDYQKRAKELLEEAEEQFADVQGGYYLYGKKNDSLIARPKEIYDGAMPSGNSVMAYCLVWLSELTDEEKYRQRAVRQLSFLSEEGEEYPEGCSLFLTALLRFCHPPKSITVVLASGDTPEDIFPKLPLYANVRILPCEALEYRLVHGKTTYYICEKGTCLPPVNL